MSEKPPDSADSMEPPSKRIKVDLKVETPAVGKKADEEVQKMLYKQVNELYGCFFSPVIEEKNRPSSPLHDREDHDDQKPPSSPVHCPPSPQKNVRIELAPQISPTASKPKMILDVPTPSPKTKRTPPQRSKSYVDMGDMFYFRSSDSETSEKEKPQSYFSMKKYNNLKIEEHPQGKISCFWMRLVQSASGRSLSIPVMVARGTKPGPVVGLTAAIHGDEVNGVPLIHAVFRDLQGNMEGLSGTVVAVPIVNVPAYLLRRRIFPDQARDVDLNRLFPGNKHGTTAEQYVHAFLVKVVKKLDYLIDFHTACFGNLNSLYIRADLSDKTLRMMAETMGGDILLHNLSPKLNMTTSHNPSTKTYREATLRHAAAQEGCKCITVEMGEPSDLNPEMIHRAYIGTFKILFKLNVLAGEDKFMRDMDKYVESHAKPVLSYCNKDYWLYTSRGGLLNVHTKVLQRIKKGDHLATVTNLFGFVIEKYYAKEDGIIIGQSRNPCQDQGGRIVHIGIEGEPPTPEEAVKEALAKTYTQY